MKEIQKKTKASRGSLSYWLRPYPLSEEEKQEKWRSKAIGRPSPKRYRTGEESKLHQLLKGAVLSARRKSKVAEVAVLLRLTVHGFNAYTSIFDGDKTDWLVIEESTGRILKIEVRCTKKNQYGRPIIPLRCSCGRKNSRTMSPTEYDILVGYDFFTDTAYVFRSVEVQGKKSMVSARLDSIERWDKLTAS